MNGADVLADTNALIAWINRNDNLAAELLQSKRAATTVITLGVLYFGAPKSTRPEHDRARMDSIRSSLVVLLPSERIADIYAEVRICLHKKGGPIPPNDTRIAALALEHNLPLLTRDAHFSHVDGLQVKSW
jgi:tRNA(fMet)-specific endonuclease VapC